MMRIAIAGFAAVLLAAAGTVGPHQFSPEAYLNHVKFLASEKLRGRGTGMPGLDKAADYIASKFKAAGLQPVRGSYFQEFDVNLTAELGSRNRLQVVTPSGTENLRRGEDYIPFQFSTTAKATCPLVFAGYGITASEYRYDDYAGIDVKDKCVVVVRFEPQEYDEKSVFQGKSYTEHSQLPKKAFTARLKGAKAVLLVNNVVSHSTESDLLEKFGRVTGPADSGIAFVQVKFDLVEKWAKTAGMDLRQIIADIDKDLKPRSFAFPESLRVDLETELRARTRRVRNVIGYLPGESDEHIVIGAHYDHLGLGEQNSLAPSMAGTPHPGADDNASGTAGLIELARHFASLPKQRRGILFTAFAGEELGLLGSREYTLQPKLPLGKAVAMLNMDMIGRPAGQRLFVGGTGTGSTFKSVVEEAAKAVELKVDLSEKAGYGASDHSSFTAKEIPILFFFSGLHADYHKPSDTWEKIDAPGAVQVLKLVAGVTERIASTERPVFAKVAEVNPHGSGSASGGGGGYGPYFGSIPDFAEIPNGVRFSDVREGSPAAKAGFKGGDILIEFDGKPIKNLYDYTYALRERKPGDVVKVKVLREGKAVEADVRLEQRR